MSDHMRSASPIACDMTALTPEQRRRHEEVSNNILRSLEAREQVRDGYALRFPNDTDLILQLAEFISLERLCCPFLDLKLEVRREHGPVWLTMSGREGVKEFLQAVACSH